MKYGNRITIEEEQRYKKRLPTSPLLLKLLLSSSLSFYSREMAILN
jgi:hypothetical protein